MADISTGGGSDPGLWRRFGHWLLTLWRRLIAALQGPQPAPAPAPPPPPTPPPPPGRLTERRDAQAPIVVPARGYVFNFTVRAAFVWSSDGLPREMLSGSAQYFLPYAVRALTRLAAARARNFPAHRAREFEVEFQRALADMGTWRYERGGVQVTCQPHVWVQLDERVKQAVRPYWEQLIKLDCEYDVDVKRAQYAERLSRQWLSILEKLVDSPVAGGAARMTNENLASVVQDLIAEQKATAQRLEDLLEERMRNGDIFEQATSFDLLAERLRGQPRSTSTATNGSGRDE
ncbi:hypothetical protein M8C17_06785 [Micromonospora sp. RHAY321]|uniref:hypothetical protein n=1 Tax=Micromonospora sp. RHAY321 TaxID=2944807 RepID=UPI00207D6CB7|nr:hypothetical protein [Micromonospora sp. RHAY321]MCO1594870.1 hypothetical protein [Micromonospora sp. RHAY321]